MIINNLWENKKRKRKTFVWRERKHHSGEMVLADGSKHLWFGNGYSTLIAFINDATSVIELYFDKKETIESMSALTKLYLKKHGLSFYKPPLSHPWRGNFFQTFGTESDISK